MQRRPSREGIRLRSLIMGHNGAKGMPEKRQRYCKTQLIEVAITMTRWPFLPLAAIPLVLGLLRPAAPSPALVWWTTHSLEKVRPYDRIPEHAPQSVKIQAARNEFEPFQIVLRAESRAIDAV